MKGIPILIQEPEIISLIKEVRDNNGAGLSELQRKLGRRKTDNAISKCNQIMLEIKLGLREYLNDPLKHELDFLKESFGIKNGREKKQYKLNDTVVVKEISSTAMLLILRED